MSKIDLGKARVFMIDKETGEQHELKGPVEVTHIGDVLLSDDVLPKNFDPQKSFTFKLKLSKRKGRKLRHSLERLCGKRVPKYLSKRDMIRAIHKMSEEAKIGHIMESDEQLMRYSAKHLRAIINYLYINFLTSVETPIEQSH